MAVTLTTPINDICFLCELDRLEFVLTGDTDRLDLAIGKGGEDIFVNSYYRDDEGKVTLYDLSKIVKHYVDMDDPTANQFTFEANGENMVTGASSVTVLPSEAYVSEGAKTFITDFFLTPLMGVKDTAPSRREALTAFTSEATEVKVIATYYADGSLTEASFLRGSIDGMATVDVSPQLFVDDTKGSLIGYVVYCGKRQAKYRVHATLPEADPVVIFRNSFGAWEPFYFTGKKSEEPSYTRSSAVISGRYQVYDIQEEQIFKVHTGYMRETMKALALDLARSKEVYLMDKSGNATDRIEISDAECKSDNADTLPDYEFTYRYDRLRGGRIDPVRKPKIFSKEFDNKFE